VEIQMHPFDLDEEEEIPIITEETEEELAELETANRPRTTSGKIQVSEFHFVKIKGLHLNFHLLLSSASTTT
jgi:hypothetical protein